VPDRDRDVIYAPDVSGSEIADPPGFRDDTARDDTARDDTVRLPGGGPRLALRRADGYQRPFLLVHGLASNARMWDGVTRRLAAAGHHVVAVDLRGHGRSEVTEDGYDTATAASDLAALIAVLGWTGDRAPIVAGQSWGGHVVALYRRVDVPALPLAADGDTPDPAAKRAGVAEALLGLPDAEVRWYAGAHHDLHAEQPERTTADLLALAARAEAR
jgi:pimeloyl-ACP methyl ester carboxylesterase